MFRRMFRRGLNVGIGVMLVAFAALLVLTAIGVWRLGTWIGFFLVYNWIFNQITSYGVNTYIARVASILFGCVVWFGAVYLWQKNRRWGIGAVIALIVLQSTFLFFANQGRYFSAQTGEPSKYYTINPVTNAIQLFDQPVFDAFGQRATPVTFEIAERLERQRLSEKLPNEEVPADRIKYFFDPYTGAPLVFYSQDGNGQIHLYLRNGYDIKSGVQLQPVTATIVNQAAAQAEAPQEEGTRAGSTNQSILPPLPPPTSVAQPQSNPRPSTPTVTTELPTVSSLPQTVGTTTPVTPPTTTPATTPAPIAPPIGEAKQEEQEFQPGTPEARCFITIVNKFRGKTDTAWVYRYNTLWVSIAILMLVVVVIGALWTWIECRGLRYV